MTSRSIEPPVTPDVSPMKRRGVLAAGAAAAGAAGVAMLAAKGLPAPEAQTAASAAPTARKQAGYQVSQHVLRYYETTKV